MRNKRLAYNTISAVAYQIISIICGFILPRLILVHYGSGVNGLVNSITHFLQVITFLDLGVGAVIQSALYKPLAENDNKQISEIISAAIKFFKKIAIALVIYIVFLCIFYPNYVAKDYSDLFSVLLILAIGISIFSENYIGVVDRILLSADQRGYVHYTVRIITIIVNTGLCALLINLNVSIQVVKFTTSIIFLFRPLFIRMYVNKKYSINRREYYNEEPIKQKWNGVAQHVSAVVLDQTDIIVLTTFSTLANVSIYSVYHLVVYGVKNVLWAATNGIQSLLGEIIAKDEKENLKRVFRGCEWTLHTASTYFFSCTAILIIPFVELYTYGVTDIEYIQPLFAVLITSAHAIHCLRLPYNILILAAGHYKQTQSNYIISALINIIVSILAVEKFGLIGVAIGTICAMLYQTIWMAYYDAKNILKISMSNFFKQLLVDLCVVMCSVGATSFIKMGQVSVVSFLIMTIEILVISLIITFCINWMFYKERVKVLWENLFRS